jgi:hypothetical protein
MLTGGVCHLGRTLAARLIRPIVDVLVGVGHGYVNHRYGRCNSAEKNQLSPQIHEEPLCARTVRAMPTAPYSECGEVQGKIGEGTGRLVNVDEVPNV